MADFTYRRRSSNWNYGGPNWKLSRSKIDLFTECKRCFYLDNVLGVGRPRGPAFTLNIAVDALLKKEFDVHRADATSHPLMKKYSIDAIPFSHKDIDLWRENFKGLQYHHPKTGFTISGAIDDVWVNPAGELLVVDYKATSKDGKIESLQDSGWDAQYKRQMEIYQWLLRALGFKVSNTGYFVYVNGRKDSKAFDGKLEFDVTLIPHTGTDAWVEDILLQIKKCLDDSRIPSPSKTCDFCSYTSVLGDVLREKATPSIHATKDKKSKKKSEPDSLEKPTLF